MRLPLLVGLSLLAGVQGALTEGPGRAEAARTRAGALANPRLDYWREQPADGTSLTNWTLAWTPPDLGR